MQLTGKEIIERGVLSNVDLENAVQQQGVDIRLNHVRRIYDGGEVPAQGKTKLPDYGFLDADLTSKGWFRLSPGYYEVTFMEGCNIPADLVIANIKTRSSLCRCGATIHCGQFDAGFKTDNMGCFLHVINAISIEKGARIGQVQVYQTNPVNQEDLYDGQWQNDKQRSTQI